MEKRINTNDDIFFLILKILAIAAIVCSVALTVFAVQQSTLDGDESSETARPIIDTIKSWMNVDDTVSPQTIKINESKLAGTYHFSGQKVKIPFSVTPSAASKAVEYEFYSGGEPEPNCFADDEGNIIYTGIDQKDILVTVRSKHDKSVSATTTISYLGMAPTDEAVEDITVKIFDEEKMEECDLSDLKVGKKYSLQMVFLIKDAYLEKYGLEDNELYIDMLPHRAIINDYENGKTYEYDSESNYISFLREFDGSVTFMLKSTKKSFFSEKEGYEDLDPEIRVKAEEESGYNYKPEVTPTLSKESFAELGIEYTYLGNDEYLITVPESISDIKFVVEPMGEGINVSGTIIFADDESKNAAEISENTLKRKVNNGECNLYWVSSVDENLKMNIKVIFKGYTPNTLTVYGKKIIAKGGSSDYSVAYDKELYNEGEVKWSIIKGENIAEFSNGVLTAKGYGKVILRAESVYYPNLSSEIEIKVRIWEDFGGFARKMLGHFLLFMFLGQGYFICYLLFIKKRWLSFVLAPLTLFCVSGITELIQLGVPGRAGTLEDVLIDFIGGICGIISVVILFAAIGFIIMKLKPESYKKLKRDFEKISLREIFKKRKREE